MDNLYWNTYKMIHRYILHYQNHQITEPAANNQFELNLFESW